VIPDRVIAITTSQGERPFHLRFSMLRSHALRSVTPASCSSRRAIQSFTTRSAIELCRAHNTHIYIPHGAILGLDGIYDARPILRNVTIETIKNPNSLGRDDTERKLCTRVQLGERANCISGMSMFMRRSRSPASDSTKRDRSLSRILPRRRILIGSASRVRESISEWISVPLRPGGDWCLHSDLSLWEFGPDFRRKRELQICLSRRHL